MERRVIMGLFRPGSSNLPISDVILRDGRSLRLRPIRPDDKQRMEDLFYRLSPRTRYLRFQYAKTYITGEELAYYTEVTLPGRCAYVATTGQGEQERILGVGRWEALPDGHCPEVAFVVDDRIQMQGVGTALLEQLAVTAHQMGFQEFVAQVLMENTRMVEVFEESGLKTARKLEAGVYYYTIDLTQMEEFVRRQDYREHVAREAGMRHMFTPRRVAVIGASRDPNKIGGAVFRNLLEGGFTGAVFPVNPNTPYIGGVLAYPSVLEVVDQCSQKGVWGLVVISAGFGEVGGLGLELEQRLRDKVLSYGMRLVGPNCLGILNADPEVRLNATFAPIVPAAGPVSMGSQSGALGIALLDYANSINLGMKQFVSIGNRVDVSSNDLLELWQDDPDTRVILLYLESFGNTRKFSRIARRITRRKPMVVVKGGRSVSGARAATSHTGALASSEEAVDALFHQAGIIRVNNIEEMFGVAQVLAHQPTPRGNRVAIITNAGGPGILAADACDSCGLAVDPLPEQTQSRLREFLPAEANTANPADMLASATPEHYRRTLAAVLDDPTVDSVVLIYIPPLVTRPEEVAAAIREAVLESSQEKPVVACFMMSRGLPGGLRLDSVHQIPSFVFPEDAVQALARAYSYGQRQVAPEGRIPRFSDVNRDRAIEYLYSVVGMAPKGRWLLPEEGMQLLRMYGVPAVETVAADSAEDAVQAARSLGFPVAMKVRSSTIINKSDVGGIALGLKSEEDVIRAYRDMEARLSGQMDGVVLQPMATGGQEVIVGMTQDPVFGPLVMLGLGGVQVEIIKDVAFSLHPLTDRDPEMMLEQLKSLPLLTGWRGSQPRDIDSLKEVLLRFSALVEDLPEIDQMEINPLLVFSHGRGCAAVDVRALVKPTRPA
jgi:acetyl coenzyme A synthetase (ADP forming)-like protein